MHLRKFKYCAMCNCACTN